MKTYTNICSFSLIEKSRLYEYTNIFHFKSLTARYKMYPASLKSPFLVYVHWRLQVSTQMSTHTVSCVLDHSLFI